MKLSFLQKLPFLLISFGLLFINVKASFIFLTGFFAVLAILEWRLKKAK